MNDPVNDPMIIWLQGGPGCSSMFGAFIESSPYQMDSNGNMTFNPFTWVRNATVVYIDSPPGTGFSTTNSTNGLDGDERAVTLDLYNALQQLFKWNNGHFRQTKQLQVWAESYGGKYSFQLASRILNTTVAPGDWKLPLDGVACGNCWVDPQRQMVSYVPYLKLHNLVSDQDAQWAEAQYPQFYALLDQGNYTAAADIDNGILARLTNDANIQNPYNIGSPNDPTAGPTAALTTYLNSPIVQQAFNVNPPMPFSFCNPDPYNALAKDEERTNLWQLRWVLNNNIPVTLYNGDLDLICDWIGTANYSAVVNFTAQQRYNNAPTLPWKSDNGTQVGTVQTAANLARVVIFNAGHMWPHCLRETAYEMALRILNFSWGQITKNVRIV